MMEQRLSNGSVVVLNPIDLRRFELFTTSSSVTVERDEDYYITSLSIDDFIIRLGDSVVVDDFEYTVNIIKQFGTAYYCIEEYFTKTAQFILPVLGGTYEDFDFNNSLYNCYLSEDYSLLYVLYKFSKDEKYLDMEFNFQSHPKFNSIKDINYNEVVIVFNIDPMWWKDIKLIMEGKYSDISSRLKVKICMFHKISTSNKTYRLLYRDVHLRRELEEELNCTIPKEIDLLSKPIKEKELWSYQSILNQVGILN